MVNVRYRSFFLMGLLLVVAQSAYGLPDKAGDNKGMGHIVHQIAAGASYVKNKACQIGSYIVHDQQEEHDPLTTYLLYAVFVYMVANGPDCLTTNEGIGADK